MLIHLRFPHYLILAATLQWLARQGTAPHVLKRQDVVFGVQVDSNTPTTLAALHGRKDATWWHERFDVKRFVVTYIKCLEAEYHIENAW